MLVKVLTCNRKIAGSGFFSPMSVLCSTFKNEEVFHHHILQRECKAVSPRELVNISIRRECKAIDPGKLVNISNLCYSSLSHIWSKHL